MKRFLLLTSVIAMLALTGVTLHERSLAQLALWQRAELAREEASLRVELHQWQTRAEEAGSESRVLTEVLAALEAPLPAEPASPQATGSKITEPEVWVTFAEMMQRDPEFQLRQLAAERGRIRATHGALLHRLKLPAGQRAEFEEIMLRREERTMDLEAVRGLKHLAPDDPVIAKMTKDVDDETEAAQRALLGEEGYRTLQDYERSAWLRRLMIGWAGGAAAVLREPFTPEQGEQLLQVLANASEHYRAGGAVKIGEPGYWQTVDTEARKILTPAQFTYFTTMEPPLPVGARYQTEFYARVGRAQETKGVAAIRPKSRADDVLSIRQLRCDPFGVVCERTNCLCRQVKQLEAPTGRPSA